MWPWCIFSMKFFGILFFHLFWPLSHYTVKGYLDYECMVHSCLSPLLPHFLFPLPVSRSHTQLVKGRTNGDGDGGKRENRIRIETGFWKDTVIISFTLILYSIIPFFLSLPLSLFLYLFLFSLHTYVLLFKKNIINFCFS